MGSCMADTVTIHGEELDAEFLEVALSQARREEDGDYIKFGIGESGNIRVMGDGFADADVDVLRKDENGEMEKVAFIPESELQQKIDEADQSPIEELANDLGEMGFDTAHVSDHSLHFGSEKASDRADSHEATFVRLENAIPILDEHDVDTFWLNDQSEPLQYYASL